MLDLPRLRRIRITARPRFQHVIAALLTVNYKLAPVEVVFEHYEIVPPPPVIFAVNHTDRYNYFPFQWRLLRELGRPIATWVKGKYYENRLMGIFMELTKGIPTVSRGYIIARDCLSTLGRTPSTQEYEGLRALVDGRPAAGEIPEPLRQRPREMLGRPFDPAHEDYPTAINALFAEMMRSFVELNAQVLTQGLDLQVFPQGTRSRRLSRGHIGLAQIALKNRVPIVPVGCNGSDLLYPGGSPWARPGRVVYRFGEPLPYDAYRAHDPGEDFEPFSPRAESAHRPRFQALVDLVMDRIDGLLDEPYRYSADRASDGVQAGNRFL